MEDVFVLDRLQARHILALRYDSRKFGAKLLLGIIASHTGVNLPKLVQVLAEIAANNFPPFRSMR